MQSTKWNNLSFLSQTYWESTLIHTKSLLLVKSKRKKNLLDDWNQTPSKTISLLRVVFDERSEWKWEEEKSEVGVQPSASKLFWAVLYNFYGSATIYIIVYDELISTMMWIYYNCLSVRIEYCYNCVHEFDICNVLYCLISRFCLWLDSNLWSLLNSFIPRLLSSVSYVHLFSQFSIVFTAPYWY